MSDRETVTLNLTREEAKALLTYTKSSLEADDNYDVMSERLQSSCEKLRGVLE